MSLRKSLRSATFHTLVWEFGRAIKVISEFVKDKKERIRMLNSYIRKKNSIGMSLPRNVNVKRL